MPLTELIDTFKHLRTQIETHGDYLRLDETRTRQVLIDPLLAILGWDVSDPNLVQVEYRIEKPFAKGTIKPDYGLMKGQDAVAVVEAKKLDTSLGPAAGAVVAYAIADGIKWAIVSDGNVWRLFDVFKMVPMNDKVMVEFTISEEPAGQCAVKSLALWNPNLASTGGPVPGQEPLIVPLPEPPLSHPFTLQDLQCEQGTGLECALMPPTGGAVAIQSWRALYTEVAKYLVGSGKLTTKLAPFGFSTGKRYAVATEEFHGDGEGGYDYAKPFVDSAGIGKGLFLETNNDAPHSLDYARQMIEKCGLNPRNFGIELDT